MFLVLTLGAISLLLALVLTPIVRDRLGRVGFLDLPDGERKRHAGPVPRVGGIAIAASYLFTFAIALILPFTYTHVLHNALPDIGRLTLVASLILVTGVLDDLIGLNAWQKLVGIGGASVLAFAAGIRVDIHFLPGVSASPWLSFLITVVWLIGCTNAFNLIDGMDGLAAGVGLFATATMLIAALTQHNVALALATMPLLGSLLGFLRYNYNPASVFLGDCGSLLIGFLLGCFGALWSEKSVTLVAMTVPLLAVSVPLLDVVLSITRRFLRNQPIFKGDRGHIHHKLLDRGLTPKGAVLVIYGVCAVAAALSLLVSAVHNELSGLFVILFCGAAWIGIRHLGYAEFAMAGRMFFRGKFRTIIDAETRLAEFESDLAKAEDVDECWARILAGSRQFGFNGVRMSIDGRIFEECQSRSSRGLWQLRVPLSTSQYINFFRDFDTELNPVVIGAFVRSVERCLTEKVVHRHTVIRMPAAPELAYASHNGSGTIKSIVR